MANHKATKKDVRQSEKRREQNRYYGKTTRNAIRNLLAATDKATAQEGLGKVISMIDKLAKRNIIHKNKAGNIKSGIVERINAIAAVN
jgi:small subunit ribosomal protein S20